MWCGLKAKEMLQDSSVLSSYCCPQANMKPGENVQNWAVTPRFGFLGLFRTIYH